jgi:hypothetical protein
LSDFFDLDLEDSVEVSVEVSLLGAFSVLVSVFLVVLLLESEGATSVFVDSEVVFFFGAGLVALSADGLLLVGLFVVVDELTVGDAVVAGTGVGDGFGLTLALAEGVIVAATDAVAAGVMVAPAVAAGVALAFVEAELLVVVPVVVVPVVAVTPTVKLGVTP